MRNSDQITVARCRCGQVGFEATGRPIMAVACYCDSCRKAAAELEALPAAQPILRADTGTDFLLYRKDRVRPAAGAERLREHRLAEDAKPAASSPPAAIRRCSWSSSTATGSACTGTVSTLRPGPPSRCGR